MLQQLVEIPLIIKYFCTFRNAIQYFTVKIAENFINKM